MNSYPRNTNRKIMIVIGTFSIFSSSTLTACASADAASNSPNWIYLSTAGILIVILAIFLGYLIKTGKLILWLKAGINAKKWKIEQKKLLGKKKVIQSDKASLLMGLGEKAWNARVIDPSYSVLTSTIDEITLQKSGLENEIELFINELKQVKDTLTKTKTEYSNLISGLEDQLKDAESSLLSVKSRHTKLTKELGKINKEIEKTNSEVAKSKKLLDEAEKLDLPEQPLKIEELTNQIATLEASLEDAQRKMIELEHDISQVDFEQDTVIEKIESIKRQLIEVEEQNHEALKPLEERARELDELINSKKAGVASLQKQTPLLFQELGVLVDATRPKAPVLSEEYQEIDSLNAYLAETIQENRLISARLGASDKNNIKYYWLMLIATIILVIAIVVLLILAL